MNQFLGTLDFYEEINVFSFIIGVVLVLIQSLFLQYSFTKYGRTPTARKEYGYSFPLFGLAIFLMVIVIRSSLALSLGMVGALSIIRFRTAVKEVEQIIYFLMLTSSSIAVAADKYIVSIVTLLIFFSVVVFRDRFRRSNEGRSEIMNASITVSSQLELHEILASITVFLRENEIELTGVTTNEKLVTLTVKGEIEQVLEEITNKLKGLKVEKIDFNIYR